MVNIRLEGSRRVSEAKRHNKVFVVAVSSTEGGLLFIAFSNPYSIVGILEIDLRKDSRTTKSIK
jgi:hypothetical protein